MWKREEASVVHIPPMSPEERLKKAIDHSYLPVGTMGILNENPAGQMVGWDGAHWIKVHADNAANF